MFSLSRTSVRLADFDNNRIIVSDYLKTLSIPEGKCLQKLKDLDIRIGTVVYAALYESDSSSYAVKSEKTYLLNISLGFRVIEIIASNIKPGMSNSLIGNRVSVLTNLIPDCESGNQRFYLITEDEGDSEIPLKPSKDIQEGRRLVFSPEDLKEQTINDNNILNIVGVTAIVLSLIGLWKNS